MLKGLEPNPRMLSFSFKSYDFPFFLVVFLITDMVVGDYDRFKGRLTFLTISVKCLDKPFSLAEVDPMGPITFS